MVRTPLKRGQGTTPGPVRGTLPEPSQQVVLSPFHVSPAPGGPCPLLRAPWTQALGSESSLLSPGLLPDFAKRSAPVRRRLAPRPAQPPWPRPWSGGLPDLQGASAHSWDGRQGGWPAGRRAAHRRSVSPSFSRSLRHERQKSEQNRCKRSRRARAGGLVRRPQAAQTLLLTPLKELARPPGGSLCCSDSTRHVSAASG